MVGGRRLSGGSFDRGYRYEPRVLVGFRQEMEMTIMRDEIFGPVIRVMESSNFEEGLRLVQ